MFHSPEAYSETPLCKQVKIHCFYLEILNGEAKEFILLILDHQGQNSPSIEVTCIMAYLILLFVCSFLLTLILQSFWLIFTQVHTPLFLNNDTKKS